MFNEVKHRGFVTLKHDNVFIFSSTTSASSSNITLVSHSLRCLGLPKKEKIIRRKRIDEPKNWDKDVEESIRQEALRLF